MPPVVGFDKVIHFFAYGLLGTLVVRLPRVRRLRAGAFWAAVAVATGYGVFDELYQSTTGRHADVYDWIADALGSAFFVALYLRWARYRRLLECPVGKLFKTSQPAHKAS